MQKGRDARAKALTAALDDMDEWLCTGNNPCDTAAFQMSTCMRASAQSH